PADAVVPEPGRAAGAARRRWWLVGSESRRRARIARRRLAGIALDRAFGRAGARLHHYGGAFDDRLAGADSRPDGDFAAADLVHVAQRRNRLGALLLHDHCRGAPGASDGGAGPYPRAVGTGRGVLP